MEISGSVETEVTCGIMRRTYKSVVQCRNRSKPRMGGALCKGGRRDGWEERRNV